VVGVSAASLHGTLREDSGFSLPQLISEFRALRATVLRLWLPHVRHVTPATSYDMQRFNEAIDQAVAESAVEFAQHSRRARDTFLAILGHDLRSPLAAMALAGEMLAAPGATRENLPEIGARVKRSAATMTAMVNDLLEYARTQLGGSMPVAPHPANLKEVCQAALHDASGAHPDCPFELKAVGDLSGNFDGVRVQQAITNLLNNAAQYRTKEHPVVVQVSDEPGALLLSVQNHGEVIPVESLEAIFDPLVQLNAEEREAGRYPASIGLGLFVVREITIAHGGTVTVDSDESAGTVFTLRLPRSAEADKAAAPA
jgi:signal transduction histidine kinase